MIASVYLPRLTRLFNSALAPHSDLRHLAVCSAGAPGGQGWSLPDFPCSAFLGPLEHGPTPTYKLRSVSLPTTMSQWPGFAWTQLSKIEMFTCTPQRYPGCTPLQNANMVAETQLGISLALFTSIFRYHGQCSLWEAPWMPLWPFPQWHGNPHADRAKTADSGKATEDAAFLVSQATGGACPGAASFPLSQSFQTAL